MQVPHPTLTGFLPFSRCFHQGSRWASLTPGLTFLQVSRCLLVPNTGAHHTHLTPSSPWQPHPGLQVYPRPHPWIRLRPSDLPLWLPSLWGTWDDNLYKESIILDLLSYLVIFHWKKHCWFAVWAEWQLITVVHRSYMVTVYWYVITRGRVSDCAVSPCHRCVGVCFHIAI